MMGLVGPSGSASDSGIREKTGPRELPPLPLNIEKEPTVISKRPAASPREFYQQMPLAELAEKLEGRTLDHFEVGQLIGGGGMGAVFRGLDKRLNRDVAIKVIPGSKRDPEMLRRFRLEAQAAARLDHPNIARVFYVGESDQWDYIVFEFIDGINIRDLVEMEGPLSIDDAVFYTRQIGEALQHAHDRDVVHRDIKPSNILVTAAGVAKLVDMGLARDTSLDKSSAERTASGITLGTFDYISPEQARNPRDADVRSDLYSLGCSLFFMLTGSPPFPDGTALQKLLNHGSLPPPDPRGWRDDLPDELGQILSKLMAKRPSDRYQKPAEMVNDLILLAKLDGLPRSQTLTTLVVQPTLAQPSWFEMHLPWIIATAFLLGSTLWLQSQTLSSRFTLPGVSYPPSETRSTLPTVPASNTEPFQRSNAPFLPLTTEPASTRPSDVGQNSPPAGYFPNSSLPGQSPLDSSPTQPHSSSLQSFSQTNSLSNGEPTNSASTRNDINQANVYPKSSPNGNMAEDIFSNDNTSTGSSPNVQSPTVAPSPGSNQSLGPNDVAVPLLGRNGAADSSNAVVASPVIVVSSILPGDVGAQHWESSLYRAIQRVMGQSNSSVIEVRGTAWLDRPIEIGELASAHWTTERTTSLTIRGAVGSNAKIEIAQGIWNTVDSEVGVIRVANAKLVLQGVEFHAALRESEMLSRSLVQLEENSALDIEQCKFTLSSTRPDFFHLIAVGDSSDNPNLSKVGPVDPTLVRIVDIGMKNCFVRGGASVLKVVQNAGVQTQSVQISIDDSLVAVEGRVLDLVSGTGPNGIERIVRMFTNSSTFISAQGYARLEYIGSGLPNVGFGRTSQACVYWSRPQAPHMEIVGDSIQPQQTPDLLLLQGINNAYDQNVGILCQIRGGDNRTNDRTVLQGQQEGWLVERGNDRVVSWKSPIGQLPAFQGANEGDFELASTRFVPGYRTGADRAKRAP